jgi:hypothetical protein
VPFLRVIRDKRGYETTYLMHWYREGHRQRSRILYVFRTPGGVRVGREALEPEVLRSIEAQYPDIDFDWKSVIDNQQVVEPAAELRRPRKRRRTDEEGDAAPPAAAAAPAGEQTQTRGDAAAPPRPPIPSAIQGATPDEQIAFLTTWYPIVRERIPQRTADPVRREALLALAERLNPATWTDADQIPTGLQAAGEALERLSHVFSKRRRRSRRSSSRSGTSPPDAQAAAPIEAGDAGAPAAGGEPPTPASATGSEPAQGQAGPPPDSDVP